MQFTKDQIMQIEENRLAHLSGATAYLSRTGRKVAVTLASFAHPLHLDGVPIEHHRVYLDRAQAEACESPDQLVNLAAWASQSWLMKQKIRFWRVRIVAACRPLRDDHKADLSAISAILKASYGDFWTSAAGRRALLCRLELTFPAIAFPAAPY